MSEKFNGDEKAGTQSQSYSYLDRLVGGILGVIVGAIIGGLVTVPPSFFYDFEGITIFFAMCFGSFVFGMIGFIKPDGRIFATLYRVIFFSISLRTIGL